MHDVLQIMIKKLLFHKTAFLEIDWLFEISYDSPIAVTVSNDIENSSLEYSRIVLFNLICIRCKCSNKLKSNSNQSFSKTSKVSVISPNSFKLQSSSSRILGGLDGVTNLRMNSE